jgi:phospholipid/cholesterol/gamma-HCH transport system substrate-binding protein
VSDSNAVLAVLGQQGSNIQATLRGLPGALVETNSALGKTKVLADELGPAAEALRPAARQLGPTLKQVRPFLVTTTPVLRDQVRPLVRAARPLVAELRPTMSNLSKATPDLLSTFKIVNTALDALAYNPPGPEEGSLFWFAWANHLGDSIFSTQDAHGVVRRGLLLASCETLNILNQIQAVNPVLGSIISLSNFPQTSVVCPTAQRKATAKGTG